MLFALLGGTTAGQGGWEGARGVAGRYGSWCGSWCMQGRKRRAGCGAAQRDGPWRRAAAAVKGGCCCQASRGSGMLHPVPSTAGMPPVTSVGTWTAPPSLEAGWHGATPPPRAPAKLVVRAPYTPYQPENPKTLKPCPPFPSLQAHPLRLLLPLLPAAHAPQVRGGASSPSSSSSSGMGGGGSGGRAHSRGLAGWVGHHTAPQHNTPHSWARVDAAPTRWLGPYSK